MKITIEGKEIELPVLFELSDGKMVGGNKITLDKDTVLYVGAGKLELKDAKGVYNPETGLWQ